MYVELGGKFGERHRNVGRNGASPFAVHAVKHHADVCRLQRVRGCDQGVISKERRYKPSIVDAIDIVMSNGTHLSTKIEPWVGNFFYDRCRMSMRYRQSVSLYFFNTILDLPAQITYFAVGLKEAHAVSKKVKIGKSVWKHSDRRFRS